MSWCKLSVVFTLVVLVGTISCWDSSKHGNWGGGGSKPGTLNIPTTPPFNPHAQRRPGFSRYKREVDDQQPLADIEEYHQTHDEDYGLEKLRFKRNFVKPTYRPPPPTRPPRPIRVRREDFEQRPLVDLEETYDNVQPLEQLRFRRNYVYPTYRPPPPTRPPRPIRI